VLTRYTTRTTRKTSLSGVFVALRPSNTTIVVDGLKFNAFSAHVGVETAHDFSGMPALGRPLYTFSCSVDMNDTDNLPFNTRKRFYDLSNATTRDKIVDMKIEFWTDESQNDAICTYSFRGWISSFHNTGGGGSNHTLTMTFTPELDAQQYVKLEMGN
jgi:hypothetical protein